MVFDVVIIGAGVSGCMIARELSKYQLNIALLERANDVAMGASKANSGIVHAGFDAKPNSLKAKMNLRGNALMEQVCADLNVPYKKNGSLVLAFSDEEMLTLQELYDRGIQNSVEDMSLLNREEVLSLEPNLGDEVVGALRAESAGIVCPYSLTIAAAEVAVMNGVELKRNCEVTGIKFTDEYFTVYTTLGEIKTAYIINAAGCFADEISNMIGDDSLHIVARRGEYYILDKSVGNLVTHTIFQCPSKMGKGILVAPTTHGNLLIGPTAADIDDKDDVSTTADGLKEAAFSALKSVPAASSRFAITSFSGNRAHDIKNDFTIEPSKVNPHFIQVAGIESPGLTGSPAIAEFVAEILGSMIELKEKEQYVKFRNKPFRYNHATDEERASAIKENPAYGRIVCRCESITEGEILDAIHAPAGALDVDGVKRRTRAGMGRCQGGFCGSKVVELLARELNTDVRNITKFGGKSDILFEKTK